MSRRPINEENLDPDELEAERESQAAEAASQAGEAPPQNQPPTTDMQRLQEERDALFDRLARATADFRNAQKRLQSELDQRVQYGNSSLIKSLLPVIDNFERALAVDPNTTDVPSLLKGMQIVHDQWLKVLKDQSVEEIAPEPGTPFDPTKHEALMQQESKYNEPTVVQTLQKGYGLHGRTLRPAKVIVSKSS